MDFVFDDQDPTVVRLVRGQIPSGLKLNVVSITFELGHQIHPTMNNARPTRKLIKDLIDDLARHNVKKVIAVNAARLALFEPG